MTTIGALVDIAKGVKPASVLHRPERGSRRLLQIDDLRPGARVKYCPAAAREILARPSDVLLAWDGANAGTSSYGLEGAVGSTLAILRPKDEEAVHTPFLGHFLASKTEYLRATAKGATVPHIDPLALKAISIELPPVGEQRRIAAILDQADVIRAKRLRAVRALDSLPARVFADAFGNEEWPRRELAHVVRQGTIVTYGIVQAGTEHEGGVPYIRTGDLVDGEIRTSGLRRTDPMIAARFRRSEVAAGDIVMSIRATVGTTALVPPELSGANLTQGTARIAPGDSTEPLFLLGHLRSEPAQRWIQAQVKGATFREITLARLRQLLVPLPPRAMQREYAVQVAAIRSQREAAQRALERLDELFASLQARAFSGQL